MHKFSAIRCRCSWRRQSNVSTSIRRAWLSVAAQEPQWRVVHGLTCVREVADEAEVAIELAWGDGWRGRVKNRADWEVD